MASLTKVQRRRKALGILGDVYAILIYTVLYIPVAVMMIFSFNDQRYNYYWSGFTTQWYGKLFTNHALMDSLWYSIIIAVLGRGKPVRVLFAALFFAVLTTGADGMRLTMGIPYVRK